MEYSDFINHILSEAADIAGKSFGKVLGTTKKDDNNQVLTETDLKISRFLIEEIQSEFPKHNIIDEETGVINNNSDFTWVIDPIDGTSNFANAIPMYGIMAGLLHNNIPVAGGLILPYFKEIYLAEKGKGTYCNSNRIHVTTECDLQKVLVAYGIDGYQENTDLTIQECHLISKLVPRIRNLRTSNSVFDLAMVAKGNYGAFLNRSSKIWDNVAQQIIIEEAGGVYTDYFGKKMDYSRALTQSMDNYTFLASSPALHEQILKIGKI